MNKFFIDQNYKLWVLLAQAREAMFKARKKELIQYSISPRQSATLFVIHFLGGETTITEMARHLFREQHSVNELINRMEKEGLVRKTKDPDKKGRAKIVLTEKGKQAYNQTAKRDSIQEIMSCLSEEEREKLQSVLLKIRDKALKLAFSKEMPFP